MLVGGLNEDTLPVSFYVLGENEVIVISFNWFVPVKVKTSLFGRRVVLEIGPFGRVIKGLKSILLFQV